MAGMFARMDGAEGQVYWDLEWASPEEVEAAKLDAHEAFRPERARREDVAPTTAIAHILDDHEDRPAEFASAGCPLLVAHGDAWLLDWQRNWAQLVGARYEIVTDAGHLPNLDQPAATAALVSVYWGG